MKVSMLDTLGRGHPVLWVVEKQVANAVDQGLRYILIEERSEVDWFPLIPVSARAMSTGKH